MSTAPTTTALPLASGMPTSRSVQMTFDELGRPLRDVTFCVVDLETTGGSAAQGAQITEIGAVKVRGGEVLGEFQTLVNPHTEIPSFIAVLTGISNAMVANAPSVDAALPAFLEFARGCVLVAHNAPFDVGFLRHYACELDLPWPRAEVIDTVTLSRNIVGRDETPNHKLSSLAQLFNATTTPDHRALNDARATVDVLHGLIERVGGLGVQTLEELQTFTAKVSTAQRRKRYLAEHLPHAPGVYLFRDRGDRVLYVGTSKDLRTRVRNYFTASETRSRMGRMVQLATRVEPIVCATPLEAEVRELRLIAAHRPPYNRRSRNPRKVHWIKLTREAWPRLAMVKQVLDDGADYFGPFASKRTAQTCLELLHDSFLIRQCTDHLPRNPQGTACALAEMGKCLAPCEGAASSVDYAKIISDVRANLLERADEVLATAQDRMTYLASTERYEEATRHRDRLATFIRAGSRRQRLGALTHCAEIIAARREDDGRWAVHIVRYGRLAAAGVIPPGSSAPAFVEGLSAAAETVLTAPGPTPAAAAEESERILRWLEQPGIRLVNVEGEWTCPVRGAGRHLARWDEIEQSRLRIAHFDERPGATIIPGRVWNNSTTPTNGSDAQPGNHTKRQPDP